MLQDIATVTGAKVISEEVGLKLDKAEINMLGKARKVIATKDNTTIVGGKGKKQDIDARIAAIRKEIAKSDSNFDKEKLQERLAKLVGGVAVIKVGAATETEMKYVKMKIEDAVEATKAAVEEGIVAGGGTALLKANAIVANAGKHEGAVIANDIKKEIAKNSASNIGYDAGSDAIVPDMLKAGIIDPVKVTRTALQNAASAAAVLLTTEAAVSEIPKEKPAMPPMPGGMGGMDY